MVERVVSKVFVERGKYRKYESMRRSTIEILKCSQPTLAGIHHKEYRIKIPNR
jgi:hypothetical protein